MLKDSKVGTIPLYNSPNTLLIPKPTSMTFPNPSRRTFLTQLSLGVGVLSVPDWKINGPLPADKKLGLALVGLGNYASNNLAPALQKTQYCRLTGIVTGTPAKATQWTKKYQIPQKNVYNYQNFDQIADNPDIDVVYVVLPNAMHHEFTLRAAKAGKHVICEKPMALSVKECQEMIEACKKAGKQLAIGYRLHFEPFNLEMARLGQQKVYGPVKYIDAGFGFNIGNPNQWRMDKALAGGGPLMDAGIYALQGTRYTTGEEPVTVTARFVKTNPEKFKTVEETLLWQMDFPSGAVASCITSYAAYLDRLYVAAEKGNFGLEPAYTYGPLKGKVNGEELVKPIVMHQIGQLDATCKSFIDNTPNIVPGEEGLRDVKIIEAIYKAAETGNRQEIKW
jgi:predicted dehydrogenase